MVAIGILLTWLVLPVLIAVFLASIHAMPADDLATAQARRQRSLFILILIVTLASVAGRVMFSRGLEQTAALFIGVPALLSMAAVFIPAKSAMGIGFKSVTLGLLISLIFLGEGILCIIMAAPLFF